MASLNPEKILQKLVSLPGPPGQEEAIRKYVDGQAELLGCTTEVDARGNLLISPPGLPVAEKPRIVVAAHLDEIALLVTSISDEGELKVRPLGGLHPWKWGETPVDILGKGGIKVSGILSFGSIHTEARGTAIQAARDGSSLTWDMTRIITGLTCAELKEKGVFPGSRVVMSSERRHITRIGKGELLASYFLDDRADLLALLLALEMLKDSPLKGMENILFAATATEETGGEGCLYLLQNMRPEICVALEIGPSTPDAPVSLNGIPSVWVSDSYSTMQTRDLEILRQCSQEMDFGEDLQWQALSRGGSDASCCASHGLCGRPVTIAFPAENSHGLEIMHRDAPVNLARLLVSYLTHAL